MVSSISSAVHNLSFTKQNVHVNNKANEEATESASERIAEARKQSQPSVNMQAQNGHIDLRI